MFESSVVCHDTAHKYGGRSRHGHDGRSEQPAGEGLGHGECEVSLLELGYDLRGDIDHAGLRLTRRACTR
jgi:hypothetical protein